MVAALVGVLVIAACGGGSDGANPASTTAGVTGSTAASQPAPTTGTGPETSLGSTTVPSVPTTGATATSAPSATSSPPTTVAPPGPTDFSVVHPPGWGPSGPVQATAFAAGASCGAALIVDRAPPAGSGPGPSVEQSYVQLCWKARDGQTLDQFMAATYGSAGGFQPTTLAGRPAYRLSSGASSTAFVDTSARRYQVVTAVIASDELRATRQAEVDRILASLSLPS